jgi:hypothetical protein
MRYIMEELAELPMKEELPQEMNALFLMERHEFIDEGSIRFPRKNQTIQTQVKTELEEMTEEDKEAAKRAQQKEAYNPYSRELMKTYMEQQMGNADSISSDELPLESKRDLLASLSALAYAEENGFGVEILDGYYEANDMILRRFRVVREDRQ